MAQKRSIFEDVAEGARGPGPAAQGGLIDAGHGRGRTRVRRWLIVLFLLVAAMIAVGGLTRLTDSGLSITEWRPVTGAVPPLDAAAWDAAFAAYRESPEFRLQNAAMTLEEFKRIYWWEWGHRQLGRMIGLVWAAGFAFFYLTRRIPAGWTGRLLLLGGLGALQGAVGWWMVSSGLTGRMVDVASYRLAVHLGLGFAILGLLAWYILMLGRPEPALLQARRQGEPHLAALATGVMHLAFLQVLLGALVAGIDAGRAFPTWPLMGDSFLPPDPFSGGPVWAAFFEDPGLVQFNHRMTGYLLALLGAFAWWRSRGSAHPGTRGAFGAMALMLAVQIAIGIATVLHSAPLGLAILHQLGAVVLWTLIIRARHRARYPVVTSIRGGRR
ncbi:MAG: COX15/CtaA family protein [Rhodobacteraceae bacterium]|nr:COX15/CtaA family protein [Paracoccaceae bacterium]